MVWLYVPGLEASNLALISHSLNTAASVTSRGKPIQRQFLSRAWRRASWMRLLSGMTLSPSMGVHGVESLISSLRASLASPGVAPAGAMELMTNDGCGQRSLGSFARLNPDGCSWRTCHVSLTGDWPKFSGIWPYAGSMRNGTCFQQRKRVPPTSANGCLSLPTPAAADSGRGSDTYPRGNLTLTGAIKRLPTPTATDAKGRAYTYDGGDKSKRRLSLTGMARLLPTPMVRDSRSLKGAQRMGNAEGSEPLVVKVGGALNPHFVEWMMGLPIGWTAFEPVGTPSFQRWLQGLLPNSENISHNMQESESNE